jgi:glycosyltransferase involved in cell wall biosynthesis
VIPNGIDLPEPPKDPPPFAQPKRVVLSLGRIHPKKGLERLVRAWARLEPQHPDWHLRIVGPDELGHAGELRAMAMNLKLIRISVEPPIYGDSKFFAYYGADVFVLPTLNENFGVTVAEALSTGTPVIATKGAPWTGLVENGCGWWIDHGVDPLAGALAQAMAMSRSALAAMGAKGRAWMARDFSWDRIGSEMINVYRWLAIGSCPPACVHFD